jgi:hypothetical protein
MDPTAMDPTAMDPTAMDRCNHTSHDSWFV